MDVKDSIYIDGSWVTSTATGALEVIDSTSEQLLGTVPDGTADDVDRAVGGATSAFPSWASTRREERCELLAKIGEGLAARLDEIGAVISNAGGTPDGLSGSVWSADPTRAERVARQMRTGQVDIDGGAFNGEAPFSGYEQSGNGRERGRYGIEDFLEIKSLQR